ncbi:hypothetical protein CH63R_13849 [Colletotrichum higginsianum IMI 349063]|uniref:Uncharacterized protein n=1 Tax=Colletotrichum higginsianum (strain IMI 349063) TaxID=759273 RepID=A0A1B7XS75_COLHI|nr:hypothetical protein CH63R_13849 [Colletotrichum higginsianum IMI 349063]OBR02623.1 hypothetical protein CH63R_13849 [Colletotrichum higginsianum IMI 349063]
MTNLLNPHLSRHSHLAFWGSRISLAFGHLHSVVLTLGHPHSITSAFSYFHLTVSRFWGSRIMTYTLQPSLYLTFTSRIPGQQNPFGSQPSPHHHHLGSQPCFIFSCFWGSRFTVQPRSLSTSITHFIIIFLTSTFWGSRLFGLRPSTLHHLVFLEQQIHGSTSITLNLDHSLYHHFLDFNILGQQIVWPSTIFTSSSRVSGAADTRLAASLRGITSRHHFAASLRGITSRHHPHILLNHYSPSTFWGSRLFSLGSRPSTLHRLVSLGQQIHVSRLHFAAPPTHFTQPLFSFDILGQQIHSSRDHRDFTHPPHHHHSLGFNILGQQIVSGT